MQLWEPDPLFVRVGAVHQGNVANSLNEVSGSLPAQFSDHGIAAFPVRHPKEQQGFIEWRIKDIEGKLSNAQVIDVTAIHARGKVVFGSTVKFLDEQTGKEIVYKIVGEDEADIKTGLISFSSPMARALIGKNEGDEVSFSAPGGEKNYEVIEVRYK